MATPALQPYVVPTAVAILLALFANPVTGNGNHRSLLWPGDAGLVRRHRDDGNLGHCAASVRVRRTQIRSTVCRTCSRTGPTGFWVLGAVFLCVTGAEALYADMGHFGRGPIKLAWFAIVFQA